MYVTLFWAVVLLLSNPRKNRAKFYLGIFMIVAFVLYMSHAIYFNGYRQLYLYFDPIYSLTSLSVYPLYYIYIKMLSVDVHFKKSNILLLLPGFLFFIASVLVYLWMDSKERFEYVNLALFDGKQNQLQSPIQNLQHYIYLGSRLVFTVQVIYFIIKGSKLVVTYNARISNFYSNLESKTIVWVKLLLISFVATSIMSILFNLLGKFNFLDSTLFLLFPSIIFSVLLFIIGLQGYMQNYTVIDLVKDERKEKSEELKEYSSEVLKNKITRLFEEEKIYRNHELKIVDVSLKLSTNRTYISRIINTDFNSSFSDFVNQYRVAEAKKLLKDQSTEKYSLDYLSEEVGFGSLHSFIRAFKKQEGITPGSYRKLYLENVNDLK